MPPNDTSDWPVYGGTADERHFSPLREINSANVHNLKLLWFHDLDPVANVMTEPLEVGGVLYVAVGYSVVRALDARTGKLLWLFDPKAAEVAGRKLRGGWGIRGLAYDRGRIFTGTHDGRLVALDAKSGVLLWSVKTTEADDGRYITGAPRVFGGRVIIGHAGADFAPVRGYVTAYDAASGRQLWRFHTVPGDPRKGFENDAMRAAARTWTGEWWKLGGGGTVWNAMTYDARWNRIYIGVGNGAPWNRKIRSPGGGDNLFLSSIVALDATSGQYVWHYQTNPGESWDYNATMDIQLADLVIGGRKRSVILHAPKNGFFYVIDRETGKLISAEKFAKVNWAERIDLASGRPVENPAARYPGGKTFIMFPGAAGAHGPAPMAFNPLSGLVYIPAVETAFAYRDPDIPLASWRHAPGMVGNYGLGRRPAGLKMPPRSSSLLAWDPVKQRPVWSIAYKGDTQGGVAATAGNLVFQGLGTGDFVAYAADTGKKLWSFDAKAGFVAQPITYLTGNRQQVTIVSGFRGQPRTNGLSKDWDYYAQPRRILTFSLDGKAVLPNSPPVADFADDPLFKVDPTKAKLGGTVIATRCAQCHGDAANSGGTAPDLRRSAVVLDLEALRSVLVDGALVSQGMPQYEELTPAELEGVQHFVRQEARTALTRSR